MPPMKVRIFYILITKITDKCYVLSIQISECHLMFTQGLKIFLKSEDQLLFILFESRLVFTWAKLFWKFFCKQTDRHVICSISQQEHNRKMFKRNKKNRNLDKNAQRKNLHSVKITQYSSDVSIKNNASFNSLRQLYILIEKYLKDLLFNE